MQKAPPIDLPPKYYLEYFSFLLTYCKKMYAEILSDEENKFINEYEALPEIAQCLFLRLSGRRGRFFIIDKIKYEEIPDVKAAISHLQKVEFVHLLDETPPEMLTEALQVLTKPELLCMLETLNISTKGRRSLRKQALLAYLTDAATSDELQEALLECFPMVRCGAEANMEMLQFLFFGDLNQDMSQFVIRDIGYTRFEEVNPDSLTPYFRTREEAEQKLHLTKAYQTYKLAKPLLSGEEIASWFFEWARPSQQWLEPGRPVFDKLVLRLGRYLERLQLHEDALEVYSYTNKAPSRERQVRIYQKSGNEDKAHTLAEMMLTQPENAEERYFAHDLLTKKGKRIHRSTTKWLKNADILKIPANYQQSVEPGALKQLKEQGWEGFYAENYLWRSLFCLLFWEILFDAQSQALHNPLQRMPSDLYHPEFLTRRKAAFDHEANVLFDPEKFKKTITERFQQKMGIANPFLGWHVQTLPMLTTCYRYIGGEKIKAVMEEMAVNVKENGRGFPDLFLFKEEDYFFAEIKSPNDQLSAQQLHWLEFFNKTKINAKVLRVYFEAPQTQ